METITAKSADQWSFDFMAGIELILVRIQAGNWPPVGEFLFLVGNSRHKKTALAFRPAQFKSDIDRSIKISAASAKTLNPANRGRRGRAGTMSQARAQP